jgi:hypothetical protein
MKKIKVGHPGRNLGKYLVKSKLPKSGVKIGKGTKYGKPTVAKPTRKRISKMIPKGY